MNYTHKTNTMSKVPYFFSFEKIAVIHSLDSRKVKFFWTPGKKIQLYFFSSEKFTCHSLNFSGWAYIKKKGGKLYFFKSAIFNDILRVIFFPKICIHFFVFFFSSKRLHFTLSFVSNLCIFFPAPEKKNSVFTHSLDFGRKSHKSNLHQK